MARMKKSTYYDLGLKVIPKIAQNTTFIAKFRTHINGSGSQCPNLINIHELIVYHVHNVITQIDDVFNISFCRRATTCAIT